MKVVKLPNDAEDIPVNHLNLRLNVYRNSASARVTIQPDMKIMSNVMFSALCALPEISKQA